MSFETFFDRLVAILEAAAVDSMVVGSLASITHGEARTTRAADVVVALDQAGAERLIAAFPTDVWYADLDMALDAVRRKRSFNVIDELTFWKVDFIVRTENTYDVEAFARRRRQSVLGVEAFVATPEDTILAKLRWAAQGGSGRQLEDVAGILRVQGEALDRAWLDQWLKVLGLHALWAQVSAGS